MLSSLKERVLSAVNGKKSMARAGEPEAKPKMQMGEPGFLSKVVRRKRLESVFLFVTSRCNSRCRTCFYSEELNKGEDLSFDQIRQLSETAPAFDKLWISGGEPFMRDDLTELIEMFYRNNRVKTINLPTNGLLGDRIEQGVGRLLEACPELEIHLNFSVDGLGRTHDQIRGVEGGYLKTIATMDRVERRFGDHPRLHRNVATVVNAENFDELYELGLYLLQRFNLATQFFEVMRGDPRDPQLKRLNRHQLEQLHHRLLPLYEVMADRLFEKLPGPGKVLARVYFMGVLCFLYRLQQQNVAGPHPWGMSCTAGKTTLVIDHDGGFRSCEMRPPLGKVQDYGCDLSKVINSEALSTEVATLGGGKKANCWCTHTCWMISSMKFSPRTLLFEIPRTYLGYRFGGGPAHHSLGMDPTEIERKYQISPL